jgi:integrase
MISTKAMNKQSFFFMSKYLHLRDNWFLCSGQRFWEIVAATIEDLAFGIRSSREPDGGGRRVCLSGASYADAEKSEWRMALKI